MKENSRDPGTGEEWYRAVVEGLTEFVTRFRTDGTCIFANEAFCKYFGVSRTEIIGHRFRPDVPEEDRDLLSAYFDSFSPDHPVSTIEHRVRVPDGSIRWNLWTDWAFFDTEGHITEFQSVGQDITDHRRGQEALRESEARFGGLIERSPLGIVLLRGSKVLYANIKTRQLLRTDPDTVRQTGSFLDYIAPEAREEIAERNRRREQGEVVPNEYETIALRRDGTKFPCHVVVSGIEMPDGMATIAFLTDITERKQAEADISLLYAEMEQRVKERTAELTRATREMEAFSYSVSHDLRAPLRAIDGFSGILMERFGPALPEEGAYYIRKVRENTLQMAALIDALLELSRFGRRELRKDVVNPYEVVREVTRELRPLASISSGQHSVDVPTSRCPA